MARQKDQVLMFSDAELALFKSTFSENEELLYLIRSVLLQFPIKANEKKQLKAFMSEDVYRLIKKRIFPEVDPDSPLTQMGDYFQTLKEDLKSKGPEEMAPIFDAKQLEYEYMTQQFAILKDIDGDHKEKIKLSDLGVLEGKDAYTRYVHTKARNFIMGYVDTMLMLIKNIAGTKTETLEQTKERMTRNSSK
jgi:hypothetical protein